MDEEEVSILIGRVVREGIDRRFLERIVAPETIETVLIEERIDVRERFIDGYR